jgi:hypothetical protein
MIIESKLFKDFNLRKDILSKRGIKMNMETVFFAYTVIKNTKELKS